MHLIENLLDISDVSPRNGKVNEHGEETLCDAYMHLIEYLLDISDQVSPPLSRAGAKAHGSNVGEGDSAKL